MMFELTDRLQSIRNMRDDTINQAPALISQRQDFSPSVSWVILIVNQTQPNVLCRSKLPQNLNVSGYRCQNQPSSLRHIRNSLSFFFSNSQKS